jgi:hypothetical protein
MKYYFEKITFFLLSLNFLFVGCTNSPNNNESDKSSLIKNENSSITESNIEENLANEFITGTYYPIKGPHQAPLGQVELTKNGDDFSLKFKMANQWEDVGYVKLMEASELEGAIGKQPELANAKGLSNGFVAFIIINPNSKIRGYSISTGIALISLAFGPGGLAILEKK